MAVNYSATVKDNRMTQVLNAIDLNASPGFMEIGTAGMAAVLVTITFSKPSFSLASGVLTMLGAPKSGVASNTGTAAAARIKDGGGTLIPITGLTVGTSGSDINLNSTSITSGQTVTLTSGTITHAS
jgi:hypothetical protein